MSLAVLATLYRLADGFFAIQATSCSFPVNRLTSWTLTTLGSICLSLAAASSSVPASTIPLRRHPAAVYWIKKRGIQATSWAGRARNGGITSSLVGRNGTLIALSNASSHNGKYLFWCLHRCPGWYAAAGHEQAREVVQ